MKHHTVTLRLAIRQRPQVLANGAKLADNQPMKRLFSAIILPLLLACSPCWAMTKSDDANYAVTGTPISSESDIQSLDAIKDVVERFVLLELKDGKNVAVEVKDLDRRLRLVNCQDRLEVEWSQSSRSLGRVTVQVSCKSPKPWRLYVQATVTMESMVWTLSRGVRRGEVLKPDLLTKKEVTLGSNNRALTSLGTPIKDVEPWLGFVFTQRVNAGKVVNERMLKPAKLVSKGEAVVIRHRSSGLELQTRGTALHDAGAREQTQVRNTSSGKIIDVVVVAPGVVDILN